MGTVEPEAARLEGESFANSPLSVRKRRAFPASLITRTGHIVCLLLVGGKGHKVALISLELRIKNSDTHPTIGGMGASMTELSRNRPASREREIKDLGKQGGMSQHSL